MRVPNVEKRRLKNGGTAYYWIPKRQGKKVGLHNEALGTNEAIALSRAVRLNELLRKALLERQSPSLMTVDRLIDFYQQDFDLYLSLAPNTRRGYDKNLRAVSSKIGAYRVDAFTPDDCHNIYVELRREVGLKRANVIFNQARMVFNLAVRKNMITDNPFSQVKRKAPKKVSRKLIEKVVWTRGYYNTLVETAFKTGENELAVAAMMAFELCQREGDLIGSTQVDDNGQEYWHAALWADYDGTRFRIIQGKTDRPVYVNVATFVPDLKAALDGMTRHNSQIINYVPKKVLGQRGKTHARPFKEDHFRRVYRRVREAAGLPADLKFMNLRHGGLTELASLEVGDDLKMALSGHVQRATLDRYVFPTSEMADQALAARLANKVSK